MPPGSITIITANVHDAAALARISISTFCDTFAHCNSQEDMDKYVREQMSVAQLTAELNDTDSLFFLMYDSDAVIGYAKMRTGHEPEELIATNPIELERIYVDKAYLGQKAGALLMTHCMAHANAGQHDVLWLGVWEHNVRALAFYERWGFTFFGSHLFVLGDDEQTDLLMKKVLP